MDKECTRVFSLGRGDTEETDEDILTNVREHISAQLPEYTYGEGNHSKRELIVRLPCTYCDSIDGRIQVMISQLGYAPVALHQCADMRMSIKGMTCESCVRTIEKSLYAKAGVKYAKVSLADQSAVVSYDETEISPDQIVDVVNDAGFIAALLDTDEVILTRRASNDSKKMREMSSQSMLKCRVQGMTCESCVRSIESAMMNVSGVHSIKVSLSEESADIVYDSSIIDPAMLMQEIDGLGFIVAPWDDAQGRADGLGSKINGAVDGKNLEKIGIKGMHCGSCTRLIEDALLSVPGVLTAKVSLDDECATISYDTSLLSVEYLAKVICATGDFQTTLLSEHAQPSTSGGMDHIRSGDHLNDVIIIDSTTGKKTSMLGRKVSLNKKKYGVKFGAEDEEELEKCFFHVSGMTCSSCVANIERRLRKVDGIRSVLVALMAQKAEVKYDPAYIMPTQIANKITALGYPATVIETDVDNRTTIEVRIDGMTCSSCVHTIESSLGKMQGIHSALVALATSRGRITFDSEVTGTRNILEAISDLGFEASLVDSNQRGIEYLDHQKATRKWRMSFLYSLVFGVPVMIVMMYFMIKMSAHSCADGGHDNGSHGDITTAGMNHDVMGHDGMSDGMSGGMSGGMSDGMSTGDHENTTVKVPCKNDAMIMILPGLSLENLLLFALCTPCQILGGRYFYVQAFKALRHRQTNMDVLIALATSIATSTQCSSLSWRWPCASLRVQSHSLRLRPCCWYS